MKISDLAGPETNDLGASAAVDVSGITSDSRKVKPGDLFVALTGTKADGSAFIADAVARGAAAVVVSEGVAVEASVPVIAVAEPRRQCLADPAREVVVELFGYTATDVIGLEGGKRHGGNLLMHGRGSV